jgi:hypothetical protein
MSKRASDWHVPADWAALLSFHLIIPVIAIIASCLLPSLSFIKSQNAVILFYAALGAGSLGSILLFFARLPLYRQRRFWTFGPRELPAFNRKLYWLAYLFVVASVLLLLTVWLKVK